MKRLSIFCALFLAACSDEPETNSRSVLLVTLDTTRPDTLGTYGGPPGATPILDALAAKSVVYDAAYTVTPLTQPSHVSLLTGLYPPRHGIRMNGIGSLSPDAETLAEKAKEAGYQTAAFVGALVLDPAFGLNQGFDHYTAPAPIAGSEDSHVEERRAAEVVDDALAWFTARETKRPYFAWVHFFDPHGPYAPPPSFRLGKALRTLYQGEVAYTDRQIGRLLQALQGVPPEQAPLVVIIADHGEAFGEHGEQTHGTFCYDPTIRVPLIVHHPDGYRAGERSSEVVSIVDLYPTLAEAMNLRVSEVDGRSFYRKPMEENHGVYFESYYGYLAYGTSPLTGWIDARGKYVHSSRPEFFAGGDHAEESDLIKQDGVSLQPYRDALAQFTGITPLPVERTAAASELTDELQDLGYAAAGAVVIDLPAPLDAGTRPSPKDILASINDTLLAQELSNQGQFEQSEELLRKVVALLPNNYFALDRLATALMRQGRYDEAVPHLRRVVSNGPGWPGSWFNLGACLVETGQRDEALDPLRRAVALKPTEELFRRILVDTLRAAGREEEATQVEQQFGG